MPMPAITENPFLSKLLCLQQDGNQAISAPANWTQTKPLLEVETELDDIIRDLADQCLGAPGKKLGRWHFFIGSPGNGKSAAVGQMVRAMIENRQCRVLDEDGTDISKLSSESVPYFLDVYEATNRFASLRIVQDASVVRNPYATDVDPAKDLLDTLQDAWDRGLSLVVCTNRGVLEKAYRDTHTDPTYNQRSWHRAILKPLNERVNGESLDVEGLAVNGPGRRVFHTLDARATFLDNRSLMLGGRGILRRVIEKAVIAPNWEPCSGCSASGLCPFKANRDWLSNPDGLDAVTKLFQRAEVLSSQVIVFREALAAISFILSGCARDYHHTTPCGWVHRLLNQEDLFGLLSRRLYMCIFSSASNRGLDKATCLRDVQLEALLNLRSALGDATGSTAKALTCVLENSPPSTDVGVSRLFGMNGVFSKLDAVKGPLPPSFFENWDGNSLAFYEESSYYPCDLESRCAEIWSELETAAQALGSHEASRAYWSVRRWSSEFNLHLGALSESRVIAAAEIDEFTELLSLLSKDDSERSLPERRRLRDLETLVAELLNREVQDSRVGSAVHLADNVTIDGRWLRTHSDPHVDTSPGSGSLTIAVRFGAARDYTTLAASMYLWLKQRARGTMDRRCIPDDLLNEAMDAKARATAKSAYAFVPNDVTLYVHGDIETYQLTRFDGEVEARVQSKI